MEEDPVSAGTPPEFSPLAPLLELPLGFFFFFFFLPLPPPLAAAATGAALSKPASSLSAPEF